MTEDQDWYRLYPATWYRKSPYFEATKRAGVTAFDVYNHMLLPVMYGTDENELEEYEALRTRVTVWDVGVERQVEITGPDAFAFANSLTPRDLTKCAVGQCKYVLITDPAGGIINDPILLRLGENHIWLSISDSDVLLWAKGVAVNSGFDVEIGEPDVSPMQIQGPKSKELVRDLLGADVAALRYYWCAEKELDGIPLVVSRTGWTGEVGYELYLRDGERGLELWDRVMEAGEPYGVRVVAPLEARRMEAGIFDYRADFTIENNPFEITGLERLVDLDKQADYIGKEALLRIHAEGVSRKLVGVEIFGEPLDGWVVDYWDVLKDGGKVGHATAAVYSPALSKNIGYVWVPKELADPGTRLQIAMPNGTAEAEVVPIPFADPLKEIPKS